VILTPGAALGSQAVQALTSLGITQVLAIGGQLALQPAVETAVVALGIKVVPIAGLDGSDSSTQLAKFEQGAATKGLVWASTTVLLAQGLAVSDALGAGVLSGLSIVPEPLLLTEAPNATAATDLGTSVIAELGLLGAGGVTNIQPLGGPLAVPANAIALAVTSL
jgi:putative cell wall-binding protein